ncbi:CYTH domain-containing protein [Candidatus Kaiserbacteria bacterium]|nr:CYTH domain-containing protein [Candidatus Kaiserbacteria bacterium]
MQKYEVEIKSLLGSAERAAEVRAAMQKMDPSCAMHSKNKQLNHYFESGTLASLAEKTKGHFSTDAQAKLEDFATRAQEYSVRTRDKDGIVFLVVKASVGDDSSANGVSRMEFEEKIDISLDALDQLVLSAGFAYQAKWSREREEYVCLGTNVTLDKNAGYGWLAEFERVVDDQSKVKDAEHDLRNFMAELGVEELPQGRLGRMFDYYNTHWPDYYGTDRIFTVE